MFDYLETMLKEISRGRLRILTPGIRALPRVNQNRYLRTAFYSPHAHPHIEIIYRLQGQLYFYWAGRWLAYGTNQIWVIPPGELHTERYVSSRSRYQLLWMGIFPEAISIHFTAYKPGVGYQVLPGRLTFRLPLEFNFWSRELEMFNSVGSSINQIRFQ